MTNIRNIVYGETAGSAAHSSEKPAPVEKPTSEKVSFRSNAINNSVSSMNTTSPNSANCTKCWIA